MILDQGRSEALSPLQLCCPVLPFLGFSLGDVSDIFYFLCAGEGGSGCLGRRERGRFDFLLKIPGGGGFRGGGRGRGAGRVSAANGEFGGGGGGAKCFFRGRNVHQVSVFAKKTSKMTKDKERQGIAIERWRWSSSCDVSGIFDAN